MRIPLILFLSLITAFSLSIDESKHLLNRTSFGYTKEDLQRFSNLNKDEAISFLINQAKVKEVIKEPDNIKELSIFHGKFKNLSNQEKKELRKKRNKKMQDIKTWWHKMIFNSEYSFREKMTLFWHNHFTSEYKVVKSPFLMYEQNKLFRENALGDFSDLLHKSSQDLAMLFYLDNNTNKKSHPNENYARELLELFTLGEGNYTEDDIKEAARAFTGYRVNRQKAILKKVKKEHDYGHKTFMEQSGNLDAEDIINIILTNRQTSKFITTKLYKEFISQDIDNVEINRLSQIFLDSKYDISVLMKHLLLSNNFWDNRANMIKSPIEMISSMVKQLDLKLNEKDYKFISRYSKKLGQELFNPPNVKGWIGGESWIDTTSLSTRSKFIEIAIKRRINKKIIKNYNINTYDEFKNYFYATNIGDKEIFMNKKDVYITLLTKPIYQLK
ncbi:MAG: DUF1800 domain-containing protein [Arcobacter sp.]|nr:DUF1800 domain-containing protein [Arcobacter sp.]